MFSFSFYFWIILVALLPIVVIIGIVALITNRARGANNMDSNQRRITAKEFFLVVPAFIALYVVVSNLLSLLFTIIDTKYPPIVNSNFYSTPSISLPVSILLVSFPLFILLRWLLAKEYIVRPELQNSGLNKWLNYLTLVLAGATVVMDLITTLYYFIDGRDLTSAFLFKVLAILVVAGGIFLYFLSELRDTLTPSTRMIWRIIATVVVLGSIIWGLTVLGSPRNQRLYRYDEQKVSDLQSLNGSVTNYYSLNGKLPETLKEVDQGYYSSLTDQQTGEPYEYKKKTDTTYELCAEFNKASREDESYARPYIDYYGYGSFSVHPEGFHCFPQTINPNIYSKPMPF